MDNQITSCPTCGCIPVNKVGVVVPLKDKEIAKGIRRHWVPADTIIEKLEYIKNNPNTWKVGRAGGQDQYAGMPSFLRNIEEIINMLK